MRPLRQARHVATARRGSVALTVLALWTLALIAPGQGAHAQAPGPKGPRDVITGARQAREARELEQAVAPGAAPATGAAPAPGAAPATGAAPESAPGAAPAPESGAAPGVGAATGTAPESGAGTESVAGAAPVSPHGGDPHAGAAGRAPPPSSARANPALPVGTIRVRVLDAEGTPVPGAPVSLGIMKSDSSRDKKDATTGPDGQATFSDLHVGDRQAYRVNVPYQGAKYSSTPFRLPPRGGYDVEIRRLPVTREDRWIVLYIGATSLELKDERVKVVQQVRLVNIGQATYVFPDEGTLVTLPPGFTAVQTQDVMTDQKVEEVPGKGVAIKGSMAPGEVTLLWGFDLPLSGTEASFSIGIPWAAFAYRVIADAAPGMSISVADMPEPRMHADEGRRFWVTEAQRRVGEEPFRTLSIKLSGIPGPGPSRWIAALLALIAVGVGVAVGVRPGGGSGSVAAPTIGARRDELLARARGLREQRQAGDIGPEYEKEQLALLTDELAALLLQEGRDAAAKAARG